MDINTTCIRIINNECYNLIPAKTLKTLLNDINVEFDTNLMLYRLLRCEETGDALLVLLGKVEGIKNNLIIELSKKYHPSSVIHYVPERYIEVWTKAAKDSLYEWKAF